MTATLPSLAKLKPNPQWAKLPLFNRKNWTRVRFDDVVENLNGTCDPAEAGLDRVIAMEHLEPGSLHIRAWGDVADGTTFTRRCRPGQVLFGKRRAYQRKVAVAEFDAVVSGDIYVLAPKGDRLLPELLPFLCLSERFFQHAVGTSAGSLSPRTNWSSLASFEFDLPPLVQQRRIAAILWAVDELLQAKAALLVSLDAFLKSKAHEFFQNLSNHHTPLGQLISNGVVELQTGPFGTVLAASSYRDSGIPMVNPVHIDGDSFDTSAGPFLSHEDAERLAKYRLRSGDIIICRKRHVGRMVYVSPQHQGYIMGSDWIRVRAVRNELQSRFLLLFLRSDRIQKWLVRSTVGSVMPGINEPSLSKLEVPVPAVATQLSVIEAIDELLSCSGTVSFELESLKTLRSALVEALLT